MKIRNRLRTAFTLAVCTTATFAAEYHVSVKGNDANAGSMSKPFRTISKGAEAAMPGDTIIVHDGIYREEINPPRGGTSDKKRIVYRAAEGEKVIIKGSEIARGWTHVEGDVWKWVCKNPDSFFGSHNPFRTQICGDWYMHCGRLTHTAQVYLNGSPLTEAANLDEVMKGAGSKPLWFTNDNRRPEDHAGSSVDLLDITFNGKGAGCISAASFSDSQGVRTKTRKGQTFIQQAKSGSWVTFENVNMGKDTTQVTFSGLSDTMGLQVEIRLDGPEGKLLGICPVGYTGDTWELKWKTFSAGLKRVSGIQTLCLVFKDLPAPEPNAKELIIWAQFKDVNPNEELVEINARETVFYPRKPGINYITVSGFTMEHASPNWAPPTAEQVGLIGTHWSKGWIIENNTIRHSSCTGVTLGKYGDEYDNTSADSAEGYVATIERAAANGWTKENIGSHIVRNNTIHSCGAAGICGSLGAIFSEISGNHIYDINIDKPWSGYEMAGIKFHAPIDMLIKDNCIHRTSRGIWLDWMTQGTRITGNLLYDNGRQDLYMEVNHGPYIVDNNIFATENPWSTLKDRSQGGAYVHNLFLNIIDAKPDGRQTPYHEAHSTKILGLSKIYGGDSRFYNNLIGGRGLVDYNRMEQPCTAQGNVYLAGAEPLADEKDPVIVSEDEAEWSLFTADDAVLLKVKLPARVHDENRTFVTTALLGKTEVSGAWFEHPDGTPLTINTDYFGNKRVSENPGAGPVPMQGSCEMTFRVWPKNKAR
ncbi:carbohydrate-binding protein [Verrucomicrobia bacterium S94]|nr:carbohydrate-binding protein [Verrucomicrobia bacterium S94]